MRLGSKLISSTRTAEKFIKVEDSRVAVLDNLAFEAAYANEKRAYFSREIKDLQAQKRSAGSTNLKKQPKSRIEAMKRKQGLWWPKASKLKLFGIRVDKQSENVISDPQAVQNLLQEYWKRAYEKKEVGEDKIQKILGMYRRRNEHLFSFNSVRVPDEVDIVGGTEKAKHSKCGRDGPPFAAYKVVPDLAGKGPAPVAISLASAAPPEGFNDQDVLFVPKGKVARDSNMPSRAVGNLRTIFLLNTDNK